MLFSCILWRGETVEKLCKNIMLLEATILVIGKDQPRLYQRSCYDYDIDDDYTNVGF